MFLEFIHGAQTKLIDFDDEEIENERMFITKVLDEFNEENRSNRKLVLLTPAGSILPPHELKDIVNQFKGCGCWALKIMFTDSVQSTSALALRLKEFISKSEQRDDLFVEEQNSGLSMASQSIVITHIFNFIKTEYSCQVEPTIAEEICKAAVELFQSLKKKYSTIGGIDNLYDKAARKGTIYQKLRYAKRKFKEEVNKSGTKQRKMSSSNMESSDETDDEKAADFIEFVKKCKLPRDTTTIKRAFEETIILRQTMMRNLEKYKPLLDLLLLSPDLILFDFHLRFPSINSKALSLVWPTIKKNMKILTNTAIYDADLNPYKKFSDIPCLINLLKLLSTHQTCFKTALKALLTIHLDATADATEIMEPKSYADIIAIPCTNNLNQLNFHIQVKGRLLNVDRKGDFVYVLDLYFKLHKILHLEYSSDFQELMIFLDHYVYGVCDKKYTPSSATAKMSVTLLQA